MGVVTTPKGLGFAWNTSIKGREIGLGHRNLLWQILLKSAPDLTTVVHPVRSIQQRRIPSYHKIKGHKIKLPLTTDYPG